MSQKVHLSLFDNKKQMKAKAEYIEEFEKSLNGFVNTLEKYVSTDTGEWTVKGFIDVYKNIFTISSDTKIVSKILEIHIFPEILKFATEIGYKIVLADHQNWYPDITLVSHEDPSIKFALDLKTTFRREKGKAGFTLGSHGAYFIDRNGSKNIQFPYNQYTGHYCLGVIYTRTDFEDALADVEVFAVEEMESAAGNSKEGIGEREVTTVNKLTAISSVIKDFDFFAVAKWKIASDARGSGNTANIGSVNKIKNLKEGTGVFHELGESWFDDYWVNYGKATIMRDGKSEPITNIWDFLEFRGRLDLIEKVGPGAKRKKRTY
jgi:hypothetical protein